MTPEFDDAYHILIVILFELLLKPPEFAFVIVLSDEICFLEKVGLPCVQMRENLSTSFLADLLILVEQGFVGLDESGGGAVAHLNS